jgi:uncharacterized membrane protein YhaH (DUF805 family)
MAEVKETKKPKEVKEEITLFGSYSSVLKKYAEFSGRLSRKGYWYFVLANFLVATAISLVEYIIRGMPSYSSYYETTLVLPSIYSLLILIPSLAAMVRRLHDIGKSGWNILLSLIPLVGSIVLLVFLFQRGDQEDNKYGAVPNE